MSLARIYCPIHLKLGVLINLKEDTFNHIVNVLRLRVNDKVYLFDGREAGDYLGRISTITKKELVVAIEEFIARQTESPLDIHLAQGIARGEKMDFVVQKAVELGVRSITPLFTEYSNVQLDRGRSENRRQHWQKVVVHACEQSGRCFVPEILPPIKLTEWVSENAHGNKRLLLIPEAENSLEQAIRNWGQEIDSVDLLVGPEGGFDEDEIALAQKNNFVAAKLGPRILRTETAALVAISILQAYVGDI